jgi:pimeloyl-ACP methyl ester carboxylesterase
VLLDPVQTFAPIPVQTLLASTALIAPGVPAALRRRVMRWIGGGADVDSAAPEVALSAAAGTDFVVSQAMPKRLIEDRLCDIGIPVLVIIAGRSVMLNPARAAVTARRVLAHGRVEVWDDASHALNGEFPERTADSIAAFWRSRTV